MCRPGRAPAGARPGTKVGFGAWSALPMLGGTRESTLAAHEEIAHETHFVEAVYLHRDEEQAAPSLCRAWPDRRAHLRVWDGRGSGWHRAERRHGGGDRGAADQPR